MNKKIICRIVMCLMIIALLPAQVHAIDRIDLSRDVNLTVNFTHEGQPLPGATIRLYKVGDISERGEITMSGEFAAYPFQLNELEGTDWSDIATTMLAYAEQDQLEPVDQAVTDEYGKAYFPRVRKPMEPGLYLITGDTLTYNDMCFTPVPTLIALPNRQPDSHHWDYNVTTDIKYTFRSAPVDITAVKVWKDESFKDARPESVDVNLLCDGKVVETVKLSNDNNWSHTWEELDRDCTWSVTEVVPEFYNVIISQDQTTFVIENTLDVEMYEEFLEGGREPEEEGPSDEGSGESDEEGKLPQTGSLWWPVPAMLIAGLGCLIAAVVRMRRDEA